MSTDRPFDPELFAEGVFETQKQEAIDEFRRRDKKKALKVEEKLLGLQPIRTLGLYQPYASLMLHGKLESRWVKIGKKPPFPKGEYLIYSTKKSYSEAAFKNLSGEYYHKAKEALNGDKTVEVNGYALGVGVLTNVFHMTRMELNKAYVDVNEDEAEYIDGDDSVIIGDHKLYALHFVDVRAILPFEFKGKQGVGFLSMEDRKKIKYIS